MLGFLKAHWKAVAYVGLLIAVAAIGRSCAPTKTITQTVDKVVYKDRIVTQTVTLKGEDKIVYRTRVIVRKPDGTTVETDTEKHEDKTKAETAERDTHETAKATDRESLKVVESAKPQWHVGALVGIDAHLSGPVAFGAQVERRIAGPFWAGAFGLSSGVGGVSLSVEF